MGSERGVPRHLVDDLNYHRERRSYGEHSSQFVDIIRPSGEPHGALLSLHGGYWRDTYGLDLHNPIVERCVSHGWAVINAEYRRIRTDSPSLREAITELKARALGPWEAMASDVHQAAMIARGVAGSAPLISLGHSAGGHLALWVAAQREVAIDAVVALAPITDLVAADQRLLSNGATRELFGTGADDDLALYAEASPLHRLPLGVPQLVVHGPHDEHVPYDMAVDYVDTARSLGDDVTFVNGPDIDHFSVIDPSHPLWREVESFLEAQRPH